MKHRDGEEGKRRRPPGRPRRTEPAAISRAAIVEAALAIVDAGGLEALSMRKLAERLGVEAMSLYTYVASKDELLIAVADRVASELSLPVTPRTAWQQRIRAAVAAWAGMQQAHPGGFPLLYYGRRQSTEPEGRITEEIMDALAVAGFDPAEVALAYQTLISFLDGALLHWPREAWNAPAGWEAIANNVDATIFPRIAENAPYAARLEWDTVFYQGLNLLLRGLEDLLGRQDLGVADGHG